MRLVERMQRLVEALPPSGKVELTVEAIREMLEADAQAAGSAVEHRTVLVSEAASLAGVSEETVRRAVRSGEIEDSRPHGRGTIRVRLADVERLKGKARAKRDQGSEGYDPQAHARRLLVAR